MSGHSKWSSIKHKKALKDARRGKLFTKYIKEITVAARLGGGDINANPRLRTAVTTARQNSMPTDNIERAIKKGTGGLEGVSYEEITYEAYGPGGVAILVQVLTDNRNRTVPTCAASSPSTAATWPRRAPSPGCSTSAASSRSSVLAWTRTASWRSRSRAAPRTCGKRATCSRSSRRPSSSTR